MPQSLKDQRWNVQRWEVFGGPVRGDLPGEGTVIEASTLMPRSYGEAWPLILTEFAEEVEQRGYVQTVVAIMPCPEITEDGRRIWSYPIQLTTDPPRDSGPWVAAAE